jgi:diketogulonate reductase-like aldo/keto reductase
MEQNLDVVDFELTDDEMQRIQTMDTGASMFFDHRDPGDGQLAQQPHRDGMNTRATS